MLALQVNRLEYKNNINDRGVTMQISKTNWLIITIVILLVGMGVFFWASANNDRSATNTTEQTQTEQVTPVTTATFNEDGTVVSYDGVEGETALATLKSLTAVRVQGSDYGEFVTGIGEVDADSSKNFWGFYINGEMATVGAGDYLTKQGDQIEWQLTDLN